MGAFTDFLHGIDDAKIWKTTLETVWKPRLEKSKTVGVLTVREGETVLIEQGVVHMVITTADKKQLAQNMHFDDSELQPANARAAKRARR